MGSRLNIKKMLGNGMSKCEELMTKAACIGDFISIKATKTRQSIDGCYSDLLEDVLDTSGIETFMSSTDSQMRKIENMDVDGEIRLVIRPATRKILATADVEKFHASII